MRTLKIILFIAAISCSITYSEAADTLKINLTYKHVLNDKGQTTGYKTIRQQFIAPDGTFFREVNYSDSTGQISGYTFRFYKNGRLFTEESHDQNDVLLSVVKHTYDAKGNETITEKLVPANNTLITAGKTVRSFDQSNKLTGCKIYSGKKLSGSSKYKYNGSGMLTNETNIFKPSAKAGVKMEAKVYSHDGEGRLSEVSIKGTDNSGKTFTYKEQYSYENGLLASVKRFNSDGSPAGEKIYKYLPSGTPSLYEEHDSTGRLTLLLQYDYKKHFMEMGTQKSYYEGL